MDCRTEDTRRCVVSHNTKMQCAAESEMQQYIASWTPYLFALNCFLWKISHRHFIYSEVRFRCSD